MKKTLKETWSSLCTQYNIGTNQITSIL